MSWEMNEVPECFVKLGGYLLQLFGLENRQGISLLWLKCLPQND